MCLTARKEGDLVMDKTESYTKEPIRWFVVFWAFAFVLSVIVYIAREDPYAPYHHNPTILYPILTALVLFISGRKYVVDRSGISVYLLGLKLQTMPWRNIREVCIVHQKALGEGDYRVYIVRKNSPFVGRDPDRIGWLSLIHPFRIPSFMVWDGTIDQCATAFKQLSDTPHSIVVKIEG